MTDRPDRPLKLLAVLQSRPDLAQRKLAQAMGISASALTEILRRGKWPAKRDQQALIATAGQWLADHGITPDAGLWQPDEPAVAEPAPQQPTLTEPKLPEPEMLTENARRFHKLPRDPFTNEIHSEEDVWLSHQNRMLVEEMLTAATAGSMIALVGECGSGKTILKRLFLGRAKARHQDLIVIEPRRLDRKQITAEGISVAICRALQITKRGMSGEERDAIIEDALLESAANGHKHLLIIDEAHNLSNDVIKLLKSVWELTHGFSRVMGIVLIGQPELANKLKSDYVREFAWRCSQFEVAPISENIIDYVAHKFQRIGIDWRSLFEEDAIYAIRGKCQTAQSLGVGKSGRYIDRSYALAINTWLTKALNTAASIGEKQVTEALVLRNI
ncbi:MAG: AAA family ATPase [Gammaproteobacteria bacterium]|nr:AAA family ATPase [Gammaproteobacteria bacterium]